MITYDKNITTIAGFERYTISRAGVVFDTLRNKEISIIEHTNAKGSTYAVLNLMPNDAGKKKKVYLHRLLALAFIPNPQNKPCVDHFSRITLDNRLENLRWVTRRENSQNRKMPAGGSSKYMGVSWHNKEKKWQVQISEDGKRLHLGLFEDERTAALVYDRKALELGYMHHNQLISKKIFLQNGQ